MAEEMKVVTDTVAREQVLEGAEQIYNIVKTTLGPKGRNVLVRDKFGQFSITHDGVTVAKALNFKDSHLSVGVELIREACKKMDQLGDGTTTVTVLTYHLLVKANELIKQGENPMIIKKSLEAWIEPLIEKVRATSKTISEYEDILSIATISVGSEELGKLVADLLQEIGHDSEVTVETSQGLEDETTVVKGFTFEQGYYSPHFVTDQSTRQAIVENPAVLLIDGTMSDFRDYERLLTSMMEANQRSLLIVANNIEGEALNNLVLNKLKGALNVVAVKTPFIQELLQDLAAVTGATIIDPSLLNWQDSMHPSCLGFAEKVVVGSETTSVIGGKGKTEKYIKRLEDDDRIARINGNVGIIKVGGVTETEVKEKKDRFDDAVAAVKAAMKGGIIAGGGVTLRDIADTIIADSPITTMLIEALKTPHQILLENSGYEVNRLKMGEGLNVLTGEKVQMVEAGIIDPTEVTCEVIRSAITTANMAITVGGTIIDKQLTQEEIRKLMSN